MEHSLEKDLAWLEAENKKFSQHWVWGKLGCQPEEFFQAFEKHIQTLNIPQAQWEQAMREAQQVSEIRVKEKYTSTNTQQFQFLQGLQA